jgi:hypothetical protein
MATVIFKGYKEELRSVGVVEFLKYDVRLPLNSPELKKLINAVKEGRIVTFRVETFERGRWIALRVTESRCRL